jgi:hypothetical protein
VTFPRGAQVITRARQGDDWSGPMVLRHTKSETASR